MKKSIYLFLCSAILILSACSSSKNSDKKILAENTWQLEFITGPKITFEGLFPAKKPQLTFQEESKMVSGNDGCNGYSAPFTRQGKKISFGEPGPSTLMYCGEGEAIFRGTMKKIDAFKIEGEKLVLLADGQAMMRFHKIES